MESPDDTGIGGVGGEAEPERARLLRKQVKVWTGQLVDLSGRNNLLYYHDLKRGTLDLSEAVPERVVWRGECFRFAGTSGNVPILRRCARKSS